MTPVAMRLLPDPLMSRPALALDQWKTAAEIAERLDKIIGLLEDRNRLVARLTEIAEADLAERESTEEGR